MDSLKKVEATLRGAKVELSYLVLSNKQCLQRTLAG